MNEENSNRKQNTASHTKSFMQMLNIFIIVGIILLVGLCLVFLPRPEYSELEKRELNKMPVFTFEEYINSTFTKQFTDYFSDTVPMREQLVTFASNIQKIYGIKSPTFYGDVNIVADDEGNSIDTAPDENDDLNLPEDDKGNINIDNTAENATTSVTEDDDEDIDIADFNNNGIIVDGVKMYGKDAGVMLFGSNKTQAKRYASLINSYKDALGENVNVYNLVVPTSVEFYLPNKFKKYSSSQKDSIDYIYSQLDDDVTSVDAYSVIAQHTDEQIYFRTDHHWTPLGAYYAYTAFAEQLELDYPDISEYTEKIKQGYVGTLYGYTNDSRLKDAPEDFHYFLPPDVDYTTTYYDYATLKSKGESILFFENATGTNTYSMFLGTDAIHTKIKTNVNNGRKIVVFKESYGNAFVPFLVNSFEEIYVIDIRYFGTNAVQYIKSIGATDVLFIDNVFAANTSKLINGIEKLYSRANGTIEMTEETTTTTAETTTLSADDSTNNIDDDNTVTEEQITTSVPVDEILDFTETVQIQDTN